MSLCGKLEADVKIKVPASKFHEMFHRKPHQISNACGDKIQGCQLKEGEWGKVGSIIYWNYVHCGKASVAKEVIEAVDEENNKICFKVIEGDLLKDYKSFRIIIQCIPKDKGSVVHWIFEYEKRHEKIPDSHSLLHLCVAISKDIEAHLLGNEKPCGA